MSESAWIAVDWGTSNLRIWVMQGQDIIHEIRSNEGMGTLSADEFEPTLLRHIEAWIDGRVTVLACGMVGSRQGWFEAPYTAAPCSVLPQIVKVPAKDSRLDVRIVAGVKQDNPADVMRGEETQIAGFLKDEIDFEGVICLPGTHSKWVEIKAGHIARFQTMMTGECFALLSEKSVLRHSMRDFDDQAFLQSAALSLQNPEEALGRLFSIRARDLLHGDQTGRAALSGVLIGSELSAMRGFWDNGEVVVIGASDLADGYVAALREAGAKARRFTGSAMTLKGLQQIYEEILCNAN